MAHATAGLSGLTISCVAFGGRFLFDEERGWSALDRNVRITADDSSESVARVIARAPCAGCVTRGHLDVRLRCLCAAPAGLTCIQCSRDRQTCRAIPPFLLGSAQIVTTFAVRLCRVVVRQYNDYLAAQEAGDENPLSRAELSESGRRLFALQEACLALRKAIDEEKTAVREIDDSARLVRIDNQMSSLVRLTTLQMEESFRRRSGFPMESQEFSRRLAEAQPPGEQVDATLSRLARWLVVLQHHDFLGPIPLPNTECNWSARFRRKGAEKFFCVGLDLWDGVGATLTQSSLANAPSELVPVTPKRDARRSRAGPSGGGSVGSPAGRRQESDEGDEDEDDEMEVEAGAAGGDAAAGGDGGRGRQDSSDPDL
ncbi:hypothetical protein F4861DRAFT_544536 [Xylaria intraflava]|nr:hypothetical protein F4861DRAFT_544536 [Xylaria intraflava]